MIAVVGVHGVGNHEPGSVARDMVELLTGLDAGEAAPTFGGFAAHEVAVPLRPLAVKRDPPWYGGPDEAGPHPFRERRGYFEALRHNPWRTPPAGADPGAVIGDPTGDPGRVSHEFLRIQLECYDGEDEPRVHRTVRWEGRRNAAAGRGAADVHVYEMYYADLSRGGSNVAGFLRGLYQLLFHFPTLGRQAIDAAVAERVGDRRWRWIQDCYTWSVRLLTLGVPVLNVVMLLAGLALLPALKLGGAAGRVSVAVAGLLGYAAALLVLQGARREPRSRLGWVATPLVAATASALAVAWYVGRPDVPGAFTHGQWALLALSWLVALVVGEVAFARFERVRRGATLVGRVALGVALLTFGWGLVVLHGAGVNASRVPEHATFLTLLVFFALLRLCWFLMYGAAYLAFVAAPFGFLLDKNRNTPRARRARAALRTAVLSHSVSTSALLLAVVVVWSGVFQYAIRHVHVFPCYAAGTALRRAPLLRPPFVPAADSAFVRRSGLTESVRFPGDPAVRDSAGVEFCPPVSAGAGASADASARGDLVTPSSDGPTIRQYFRILLVSSVGVGLPIALVPIGAALLVLVWMVLPSARFEGAPPGRPADPAHRNDTRRSRWLGAWLRTGLDAMPYVSWLVVLATFVVIPAFVAMEWLGVVAPGRLLQLTVRMLDTTGAFLAASAVAATLTAVKLGSTALDVILDVDNYLRTYPEDSTPTARIAERYASMLRHLCAFEQDGRRYDAVVIVSHSLGTAVTADALRLLTRQAGGGFPDDRHPDESLARLGFGERQPADGDRLRVHLFTMGSPLRQLMNRFFPHRFWWVRPMPDGADSAPEASLKDDIRQAAPPDDERRPSPAELGAETWSNAYRSGDYVGRELWLGGWYQRSGDDAAPRLDAWADAAGGRWEACVGTGAHTHYWDATAPDVARRLADVVDVAAEEASAAKA